MATVGVKGLTKDSLTLAVSLPFLLKQRYVRELTLWMRTRLGSPVDIVRSWTKTKTQWHYT